MFLYKESKRYFSGKYLFRRLLPSKNHNIIQFQLSGMIIVLL